MYIINIQYINFINLNIIVMDCVKGIENDKNDKTNVNIYSLTDLIPVILSELSIKDLLNVSQTNRFFYDEVKYIKKCKLITKSKSLLARSTFDSWQTYILLKLRGRVRMCSWHKRPKDPERPILLF
jgi:hypothetical protein